MLLIHSYELLFFDTAGRLHVDENMMNISLHCRFQSGATGSLIMNNQSPAVLERMELTGEHSMLDYKWYI